MTYNWDFDDGGSDQGEQVQHTYAAGGMYTVELTVSNACGEFSVSHSLTVAPLAQSYLPVITK